MTQQRQHVWLLPNSFTSDDVHARVLAGSLRSAGLRTQMLMPRSPAGALLPTSRGWAHIESDGWVGRIDRRLVQGRTHGVITIDRARRKGPFPLDLASNFLHPLDRMRLLTSGDRSRAIANIAAAVPVAEWTIAMRVGSSTLWLHTHDTVAAELWSLALAERFFDRSLEMRGPWEDDTVQRATELDVGVRVPSDIRMVMDQASILPQEARELISHGCQRLGLTPEYGDQQWQHSTS